MAMVIVIIIIIVIVAIMNVKMAMTMCLQSQAREGGCKAPRTAILNPVALALRPGLQVRGTRGTSHKQTNILQAETLEATSTNS